MAAPTSKSAAPVGKPFAEAKTGEVLEKKYGDVGKNPPAGRTFGVVMHPTSLHGPHGTGDLSTACFEFVDWLASAGARAWQVLPLVPPDEKYFSPYSGQDALCGNPLLISLQELAKEGLIPKAMEDSTTLRSSETTGRRADAIPAAVPNSGQADFPAAEKLKLPLIKQAAEALLDGDDFGELRRQLQHFREVNAWVEESALFDCIRREPGREEVEWWDWEAPLRDRDADALAAKRKEHTRAIDIFVATQLLFDKQWGAVKAYANSKNVDIIGDMPIYVGGQSADVWAHRHLFELSATGEPEQVSGVPPDAFSDTGQLWGSPLYRWEAHEEEGFAWWARRIGRAGQVYDQTRIDHFRAFAGYWAVGAEQETAMVGDWRKGPGKALFDAVAERLGEAAPFIMAEDLGVITEDVKELRRSIGAPGMVVLQFAWGGGADNTHLPHNHYANSFVYPGTHDNETSVGWYKNSCTDKEKIYLQRYLNTTGQDIAGAFMFEAMKSVSATCMIMMQDILRLDNAHRMNSPGKAEGNWGWRLPDGFSWRTVSKEAAELRSWGVMFDRVPKAEAGPEGVATGVVADPLEEFCATEPDADECRIYED